MFSKKIKISDKPCATLSEKVKKLNGKSAERLRKSIKSLEEALKEEEEENEESEEEDS